MSYLIYPKPASNSYTKDLKRVISLYDEEAFCLSAPELIIQSFTNFRRTTVFLNWIDNWVFRTGKFSILGFLKLLVFLLILRFTSKKIVFVRHNIYPHKYKSLDKFVKFTYRVIYFLTTHQITHSKRFAAMDNIIYIPCPLPDRDYVFDSNVINLQDTFKKYFLIYGRIDEYKKIEEIIKHFQDLKLNLIIAGRIDNTRYHKYVKKIIGTNKNIKLINGYIDTKTLESLITNSQGVIVNHMQGSIIVSGSIIHTLSVGGIIISRKNFFTSEIKKYVDKKTVFNFKSVKELDSVLSNIKNVDTKFNIGFNKRHSDDSIYNIFNLNKIIK